MTLPLAVTGDTVDPPPAEHLPHSREAKEVIEITNDLATVIIGTGVLVIAFAFLVLKIIEVARFK